MPPKPKISKASMKEWNKRQKMNERSDAYHQDFDGGENPYLVKRQSPTSKPKPTSGGGAETANTNPNLIEVGPRRKQSNVSAHSKPKTGSKEKGEAVVESAVGKMAPASSASAQSEQPGPQPSFIEVAKPYIFERKLQECIAAIGMNEAKEDNVRLPGVAYIDSVRRAMQLPVRTFNTAVVYYHKFRLLHADHEYMNMDAAAAALFTACKIEDTLKKSREILCAAYNMKLNQSDHLSPDDPMFEPASKVIIGLERLMLEGAGFDFRNRHPQKVLIKIIKVCGLPKQTVGVTAYNMSLDLYRTFAPLKQTAATMAIACVELSARLYDVDLSSITGLDYKRWSTSRAEVMETLLDLLDLYTHHRMATSIGPSYSLDTFINIRITLNQEADASSIPRYADYASPSVSKTPSTTFPATNGVAKARNGAAASPTSPLTPSTPATTSPGQGGTGAIGVRGQSGTVRFMLDAARAREEKKTIEDFFKVEEEEYEVEVEVPADRRRAR